MRPKEKWASRERGAFPPPKSYQLFTRARARALGGFGGLGSGGFRGFVLLYTGREFFYPLDLFQCNINININTSISISNHTATDFDDSKVFRCGVCFTDFPRDGGGGGGEEGGGDLFTNQPPHPSHHAQKQAIWSHSLICFCCHGGGLLHHK